MDILFIKQFKKIILGSIICCLLTGCLSTKSITYFQPVSPDLDEQITKIVAPPYTPVIKSGDILSINLYGLDKDNSEMFNPIKTTLTNNTQNVGVIMPPPIVGYNVDAEGNIALPLVGKIYVAGMTSKEVETNLTGQLEQFIKSPTVTVRIANQIISVLGEVVRPAQYVIPNEHISLPEALALAGDLTIYGKRTNILIIREIDGQRQFARVDITKRDMFDSQYYYLKSGDIIYVESTPGRLTSMDRIYQLAPVALSSLTLMMLIYNTFIK